MMKNSRYIISALGVLAGIMAFAAATGSYGETLPATSVSEQPETCPYVIREGDTLSKIARQLTGKAAYFTDIMRSNHLASETIYPGEILQIPRNALLSPYQCDRETPQARSESPATPISTAQKSDSKILAEIESMVFEDRNNNGTYDADEPGVSGIKLILVREGRVRTSDEQGLVVFTDVEPGEHAVGLEESTLPDGFKLCTASTVLLTLNEGDKGFAAFGIRASTPTEPSD